MNPQRWQQIVAWFVAATFMVGVGSCLHLVKDIGRPFGGHLVIYSIIGNNWEVEALTPPTWPGLASGALKVGDFFPSIQGYSYQDQVAAFAAAAQAGHRVLSMVVANQDGQQRVVAIPIVPFGWGHLLDHKLPLTIIGATYWLLGLAVYRARPQAPLNQIFALFCSSFALFFWLIWHSLFPGATLLARLFELYATSLARPLWGVCLIHLILLFPAPSRFARPFVLLWLYGYSFIVSLVVSASYLLLWMRGQSELVHWLALLGYYGTRYLQLLALIASLARLGWLVIQGRRAPRLWRQAMILLSSLGIASPVWLSWTRETLFGTRPSYYFTFLDTRYLLLAIPISLAYIILRYQTFRAIPPLFVGAIVLASSALFASANDAMLRSLVPSLAHTSAHQLFVPAFVILLLSSSLWSVQHSLRSLLTRLLQRDRLNYQVVNQYGQRLLTHTDWNTLPKTIVQELADQLEVNHVALWLYDEQGAQYHLAAATANLVTLPPYLDASLIQNASPLPCHLNNLGSVSSTWLLLTEGETPLEIIVPLVLGGERLGLLAIGSRWGAEVFDERDMVIVELIAQQITLFLQTTQQIERLRQVPQLVTEAQEQERHRLARELHDTVQQYLGRLPFFLESSRLALQHNPAQADALLRRALQDAEQQAANVREISHALSPRLDQGLAQPLRELVAHYRQAWSLVIELEIGPDVEPVTTPLIRHALFRVVQQALDNVLTHAHATRAQVRLTREQAHLHLLVCDDGCGFSLSREAHAREDGRYGLVSMRARIESIGGALEVRSQLGTGTNVRATVPLNPSIITPA